MVFQRFIKVLLLSKQQTVIELKGQTIEVGKKEKKLGRMAQSIVEFIPLFMVILVMNDPTQFSSIKAASVFGFLTITAMILLVFVFALLVAFIIYWVMMYKELK